MSERISPQQFHASDGVEDWRVVSGLAVARFRTKTFGTGLEFVEVIGKLADSANHHPDVDLRYASLTVTLTTHAVGGLSALDAAMARQISAAARALDIPAEPEAVQVVGIAIDALAPAEVLPFWRAVLGYESTEDLELVDPQGRNPGVWFQQMEAPRKQRNRIHLDVYVPHDQAEARVAAALAAGGHLVSDAHAPRWWTLADKEGNEVDLATWLGRDQGA